MSCSYAFIFCQTSKEKNENWIKLDFDVNGLGFDSFTLFLLKKNEID